MAVAVLVVAMLAASCGLLAPSHPPVPPSRHPDTPYDTDEEPLFVEQDEPEPARAPSDDDLPIAPYAVTPRRVTCWGALANPPASTPIRAAADLLADHRQRTKGRPGISGSARGQGAFALPRGVVLGLIEDYDYGFWFIYEERSSGLRFLGLYQATSSDSAAVLRQVIRPDHLPVDHPQGGPCVAPCTIRVDDGDDGAFVVTLDGQPATGRPTVSRARRRDIQDRAFVHQAVERALSRGEGVSSPDGCVLEIDGIESSPWTCWPTTDGCRGSRELVACDSNIARGEPFSGALDGFAGLRPDGARVPGRLVRCPAGDSAWERAPPPSDDLRQLMWILPCSGARRQLRRAPQVAREVFVPPPVYW